MSMLTHTYLHKTLRKNIAAICNHQIDSPCYLCSDNVCSGDLQAKKTISHTRHSMSLLRQGVIKQNKPQLQHWSLPYMLTTSLTLTIMKQLLLVCLWLLPYAWRLMKYLYLGHLERFLLFAQYFMRIYDTNHLHWRLCLQHTTSLWLIYFNELI